MEILLPVEALIPSFYIPDSDEKISVYQKLAGSEDEQTLAEFEQDLVEEYGELPQPVRSLFEVLRLKLACRRAGVVRVKAEDRGRTARDIVLTLSSRVQATDIFRLLQVNSHWKISSNTLRIPEEELSKRAKERGYLKELTEEVKKLTPIPKEKKKKPLTPAPGQKQPGSGIMP